MKYLASSHGCHTDVDSLYCKSESLHQMSCLSTSNTANSRLSLASSIVGDSTVLREGQRPELTITSTSNEAIISSVCKCNATPPTQSLLHLITRRREIVLGNPLDLPVRRLRCLHFDWKMQPRAVLALVLHEWRFPQQTPTSLLQTCHLKITAIPRTKPTDLPFLYKPDLSMPSVVSRSYFMRSIGSECWQVVTKQYILIP
mmetsp:Transcript_16181/g.35042  ORF Transcript_16181/g.35042 Transcript_16181/m.35042 type:complete len:201 (+) Transcript_16181:1-603(+)